MIRERCPKTVLIVEMDKVSADIGEGLRENVG